jgi:hypothetical protein
MPDPTTAALPGSGLPPYDTPSREGELSSIESSGRPDPTNPPAEGPRVEEGDLNANPVQPAGTDHDYSPPAGASEADVDASKGPDQSAAPAPFRRRDGFPDITTESVQVQMLADYYPPDPSRFGNQIRAREGDIVSFGPEEALALIDAGLAVRLPVE